MTPPQPVRIVIADDHPIFRDGLRRLLEAEEGLEVVGEAMNADEALRLVRELNPAVLLLDVAMPGTSGVDALRALGEASNPPYVILLTAAIERADIARALQYGARGVVLKESATALLLKAIRIVMDGGYWVGPEGVPDLFFALQSVNGGAVEPADIEAQTYNLTPRELQIVSLIAAAAGNKRIADTLNISEKTVKHHLTNIFEKLGVSSRLELALFAAEHNLLSRR